MSVVVHREFEASTLRLAVRIAATRMKQDEDQDDGRFDLEKAVEKAEYDEDR